ncbi:hypothetical protein [Aquibacillus albus]|uniref:Nicotinamidase-related amidase n=1 Tax=Aquibacillus albus TaxID=1168171 RepID=A0ABS2N6H7_9BACI|nr:hypothetical protein [Aquibacillus albus]MBM7573694.1 nicotinamidase-related amidase [Aquibacillus albus]
MTVKREPMKHNFDLNRTAVIVVDMQNVFAHPEGELYVPSVVNRFK